MATITRGGTTIAPTLILGYETERDVPTLEHELLDGEVSYTVQPARLRSGTLELFFATQTAAQNAFELHAVAGPLELVDSDLTLASMTYLVMGRLRLRLDDGTRRRWTLSVPYREVAQ